MACHRSQIWSWNGKIWLPVTTPSPTKSEPNLLTGVTCSSAQACTAVGFIGTFRNNHTKDLIETGSTGA
jgi:hypothetical protein